MKERPALETPNVWGRQLQLHCGQGASYLGDPSEGGNFNHSTMKELPT